MMSSFMMKDKVSLGVEAKIIHIDFEPSFCDHISKYVVHKCLESGWCITKAEEHNSGFEKAKGSDEGCLPLVRLADTDVVIPPSNVEFSEEGGVLYVIDEFRDKG